MKLRPATSDEVQEITDELLRGKSRPQSGDFLDGFPWDEVSWHKADLELLEFENLYLFWDGSAWGRDPLEVPRTLHDGTILFQQLNNSSDQSSNVHLNQIRQLLQQYRREKCGPSNTFLILGGQASGKHHLILDGNHRAIAALWFAIENQQLSQLPLTAWVGLSPRMNHYWFYGRIQHI